MKTLKYIFAASLASTMVMTSCNDFIDLAPVSSANASGFYQTESELQTAMYSVYNTLYDIYGPDVDLTGELAGLTVYAGVSESDDAYAQLQQMGDASAKTAIYDHVGLQPDNSVVLKMWQTCYKDMFKVNQIIEKAGDYTYLVAEARFLRALYYFDMTRTWGDIPLVMKPVQITEAYEMGRTSQSEVFNAIVEDLKYAAQNLPTKNNARFKGAANSDAAYALLGKVYLTMGDKNSAKDALLQVYNNHAAHGIDLVEKFSDLWGYQNNNNAESIFEIQFVRNDENLYSHYYTFFVPFGCSGHNTWGQSVNAVTPDLYKAMEGDPRRDATIASWDNDGTMCYWFCKWVDTEASMPSNYALAGNDYMVLRYADVLLMLSEATGDKQYMNMVQKRAGVTETEYSTDNLLKERRMEFAGEFHRWFDLMRIAGADGAKAAIQKCSVKGGTPANVYLPIPSDVITQSPIITQNAGY